MKIRQCVLKMEKSGLREVIRDWTFDAYKDTESWQTIVKRGAMDYADNVNGWLLSAGKAAAARLTFAPQYVGSFS